MLIVQLKKRRFIISRVYNTSFFLRLIGYDNNGDDDEGKNI